jgi:hypothetical protein
MERIKDVVAIAIVLTGGLVASAITGMLAAKACVLAIQFVRVDWLAGDLAIYAVMGLFCWMLFRVFRWAFRRYDTIRERKPSTGESIIGGLRELRERLERGEEIHATRVTRNADGTTASEPIVLKQSTIRKGLEK